MVAGVVVESPRRLRSARADPARVQKPTYRPLRSGVGIFGALVSRPARDRGFRQTPGAPTRESGGERMAKGYLCAALALMWITTACAPGRVADLRDSGSLGLGIGVGLSADLKAGALTHPSLGTATASAMMGSDSRDVGGAYLQVSASDPHAFFFARRAGASVARARSRRRTSRPRSTRVSGSRFRPSSRSAKPPICRRAPHFCSSPPAWVSTRSSSSTSCSASAASTSRATISSRQARSIRPRNSFG